MLIVIQPLVIQNGIAGNEQETRESWTERQAYKAYRKFIEN